MTNTGSATGFAYTCSRCGANVVNSAHTCPDPTPGAPDAPKQCRQCGKWHVPNPARRNVSCCVDHGGGCCHYSETEVPPPDAGRRVEEARKKVDKQWPLPKDLDALIDAARSTDHTPTGEQNG